MLDALGDLRGGVLDELRLVEDERAEVELVQLFEVAAEQRVVGDDDVVLGDLLAQAVAARTALEDEHLHVRDEFLRLAPPVVQHGRRANHERGLGVLRVAGLEPRKPDEGLQSFAEAHVVGEDAAEAQLGEMAEEVEAFLLIRAEVGDEALGQLGRRDALEVREAFAEHLGLLAVAELLQALFIQMRGLLDGHLLRDGAKAVETKVGEGLVRGLHGLRV